MSTTLIPPATGQHQDGPRQGKDIPVWAVQRVETALDKLGLAPHARIDPQHLARKTGLSKSLARRCVQHLRRASQ